MHAGRSDHLCKGERIAGIGHVIPRSQSEKYDYSMNVESERIYGAKRTSVRDWRGAIGSRRTQGIARKRT